MLLLQRAQAESLRGVSAVSLPVQIAMSMREVWSPGILSCVPSLSASDPTEQVATLPPPSLREPLATSLLISNTLS